VETGERSAEKGLCRRTECYIAAGLVSVREVAFNAIYLVSFLALIPLILRRG